MNESKISVRYAKAIDLLSIEKNVSEKVFLDMQLIYAVCEQSADFLAMLENPVIKPTAKQQIFSKLFEKRVHEITFSFLLLLIKNNRENYIKDISRNFISRYKAGHKIKSALLTTAIEIDDTLKQTIMEQIKASSDAKEVELNNIVNSDLLGGYILRIDDIQIDASLRNNFEKLKRELVSKDYKSKL